MVKSFTETTFNQNPNLRDYSFDFDKRQFIGPDGNPVSRDSLLLGMQPRPSDSSGGSRRTPAASVFLDSLARQPSGKRPGLLALVDRRPAQLVESFGGPLFSRTGKDQTETPEFKAWFGKSASRTRLRFNRRQRAGVEVGPGHSGQSSPPKRRWRFYFQRLNQVGSCR